MTPIGICLRSTTTSRWTPSAVICRAAASRADDPAIVLAGLLITSRTIRPRHQPKAASIPPGVERGTSD